MPDRTPQSIRVGEIVRATRLQHGEDFRSFADEVAKGLPPERGYTHATYAAWEAGEWLPERDRLTVRRDEATIEWVRQFFTDLLDALKGEE